MRLPPHSERVLPRRIRPHAGLVTAKAEDVLSARIATFAPLLGSALVLLTFLLPGG